MNLTIEKMQYQSLAGYYFPSTTITDKVVIIFGGSEGSCNYEKAKRISKHKYPVLALYFFGKHTKTKALAEVDISFFDEVINFIQEKLSKDIKIIVIGQSKGAELSLLLGTYYPIIDKIIAIAPPSHSFFGLGNRYKPSFLYRNKAIEFLSFKDVIDSKKIYIFFFTCNHLLRTVLKKPISYRKLYWMTMQVAKNKEEARIKIEKFDGDLLLIAGGDDQLWPADMMAKAMYDIRQGKKTKLIIYEEVGHNIGESYQTDTLILGGPKEGQPHTYEEMVQEIITFIG